VRNSIVVSFVSLVLIGSRLLGDGPSDNKAESVRPVPPPGVAISEELRSKLFAEIQSLKAKVSQLQSTVSARGHNHERMSSFTYREYDHLNNVRQVPKLLDWLIVDLTTPADSRWPGKIEDAGFFDENWRLKPF